MSTAAQKRAFLERHPGYFAEWYTKNRERLRTRASAYYVANREHIAARQTAYNSIHSERVKATKRAYYERNKERVKHISERGRLRRRYGLTPAEVVSMRTAQGNRCAVCGDSFSVILTPHVDHDHKTGRVRGLLCRHCNAFIGHAREDTVRLNAAIAYLTRNASGVA